MGRWWLVTHNIYTCLRNKTYPHFQANDRKWGSDQCTHTWMKVSINIWLKWRLDADFRFPKVGHWLVWFGGEMPWKYNDLEPSHPTRRERSLTGNRWLPNQFLVTYLVYSKSTDFNKINRKNLFFLRYCFLLLLSKV